MTNLINIIKSSLLPAKQQQHSQPAHDLGFSKEQQGGFESISAVLFIDLRDFAIWSQEKPPSDIIYIINQYFTAISKTVRQCNGWVDKYMGDGVLAVFGHTSNTKKGCIEAITAARRIDHEVKRVNSKLSKKLKKPISVGMGLHVGPLIIGLIGENNTSTMTSIGPVVNNTVNLEQLTKEKQCQIILTESVAAQSGLSFDKFQTEYVLMRDVNIPIEVFCIEAARHLPKAKI
ncbi:MAG: adenylate/guanylate cyclase domain-containing protein [Pseudomonadota bacterium]